ncbi:hypothetical protein ACFLY8_04550 [Halobacteriota archaeon]
MPEVPKDIKAYQERFFTQLRQSLANIETIARDGKVSMAAALIAVGRLKPFTEHINQAHHEALCFIAVQWLQNIYKDLEWSWQPTSTGAKDEADVEGRDNDGTLVVAAECSASIAAKGALRKRMNSTLEKLSELPANHKYYFVATEAMTSAAENRVKKIGYSIIVKQLPVT